MNGSFFTGKPVFNGATNHHVRRYIQNPIPCMEPAWSITGKTIDHPQKNFCMKRFLPASQMVVIALLLAGLFVASSVSAQISVINSWAQQYASNAYPTGNVNASYAIPNGSNRLLVVAVATTRTSNGSQNCTVTYGGVALTQATGDGSVTSQWNHSFIFYLNDANIGSAASGKPLAVTVSNGTSYYTYVGAAVYSGVNQATPFTSAVNFNTAGNNSSSVGPLNSFNVNNTDQGISVINLARDGSGTTVRSITGFANNWSSPSLTSSAINTNGATFQSYIIQRSVTTAATNEAATHTASSGNTFSSYSAVSLKAIVPTISTGSISGSPFCVTAGTGAAVTVPFTSVGTYTANTYTAQLSNAAGSFASPVSVGTLVSNANSGSISATIPQNTASGTGYRIRVVSSSPAVTGTDNGANLTINLATSSIAPTTTQNLGVALNGSPLTVTESTTASSRQWFVGTTSGGPYTLPTGVTTPTYTPMFGVQGTYYVVCISTFACGTVTSNQVQVNVSPTVSTGSITGSPFCITTLDGSAVSVPFTSNGTFAGNTYTAQLSNASGSFTSPVVIGTLASDLNAGTIDAHIPANTASGTGYRIRVISSNPLSIVTDNGSNLTINLSSNSVAPSIAQTIGIGLNGNTLTVSETPAADSREWFYGTSPGGPYDVSTGETSTSYTPNFGTQGSYYVVCVSTFACGTSRSNVVQVNVVPIVSTGTISGSPFCVTTSDGAPVSVPFTSIGTFTGNTYTAQLSNALGSFVAPVNIGTLVSDDNSGTIDATIPAGITSFGGYRIRVISSSPGGIYTDNGTNLTINLSSNSIAPVAIQNTFAGVDGSPISVNETPAANSREWFYSTVSGGPYTSTTGITSTSFTPNFAIQGTYYVVCVSTFDCGTATSNQVQVNVAATVTTGTISGSPFCAGSSFDVPFTSAGGFSGNTYTAQLSNATGSFASPVNIGSLGSDANSGLVTVTIPAGTSAGTGYLIRIIASNPNVTGSISGPITVNRAPVVNFVANVTSGTTGTIITFTDQSTNGPTSWAWTMTGATPSSSSVQNPVVSYNSAGTFSVTLDATNACGTSSFTRSNYIAITALTMPAVFGSSGSFTVPPGVTCIKVEAWGGGGAGGGAQSVGSTTNGGGGAGGAYASSFLPVTSGTIYPFTVAGQKTATASSTSVQNTGDASWFFTTGTLFAQGGEGGTPGVNTTNNTGGTGSTGSSIGGILTAGINGGNGTAGGPGGQGGNGGGAGGAATAAQANGNAGSVPGGGGSGGRRTGGFGSQNGGTGAAGQIKISWVDATNFGLSAPSCTDGITPITINSTSLANGSYTVTYSTTNPDNTGLTATMNFSGGTGSFNTIALTGSESTITVNAITFTGWTCSTPITANNTASVRLKPTASISYVDAPFCSTDASVKSVTLTGATGGTFSATPAGLSIDGSTGEINPALSTPNTYTVRYDFTDGFCPSFTTTTVIIGTPPVATFSYPSASYCQYLSTSPNPLVNPSPVFSGGGIAGTFTSSPAGLNFVDANTGQINLATTAPGSYTIINTVTVNGCTTTAIFDIVIYPLPTASISYNAAAFCHYSGLQNVNMNTPGFSSGSYSASPAGLTINGSNDLFDPNAGQIDPSTSAPGTYTVTYTFTDGTCSNTTSTTVVISAPADVAVTAEVSSVCINTGTNILVASSSASTSYQLRNNADNSPVGAPLTGNGGTLSLPTGPLTSTTSYNVLATVTGTGCLAQLTQNATVTVKEQPTASAGGTETICSNGAATVSGAASSNGTILWTHNGAGTLTNATTLTPTYHAVAADGGNTVTLTMTVSNSPCIAATATYSIVVNPLPVVSLNTSIVCIGSSSTLLSPVSGGTWISNNPSIATVDNNGTVNAIAAGNVTFTFTNGLTSCSNTTTSLTVDPSCQVVTLSQPTQLTATISGDASICGGQPTTITVVVAGGTPPYKVTYNGTDYTAAGSTITFNVAPTSTTVYSSSNVIVSDAHNCTSQTTGSATVSIIPESAIVLQSGQASQVVCNGLPIADITYALGGTSTGASLSGGTLPTGVNGVLNGNNFIISGIPTQSGTFNFTITTSGPCPASVSGTITVNPTPDVTYTGLASSYCVNAASVLLTGNHGGGSFAGAGITDHGDGTATFNPNEAGPGTHSITYSYTNASGCSNSQSQTVTVNALPVLTCPANLTICLTGGSITLPTANPAGGIYSGTGVNAETFDPAVAGVGNHQITYTYTDVNGCTNTCSFTINVVQLALSFDNTPVAHCGSYQPAPLIVIASGGIPIDVDPAYFYQWQQYSDEFSIFLDIPGENGSSFQPPVLTPGTYIYRVRVIDQCGEIFTESKTIVVNSLPVATISYGTTAYCGTGTANVTQTGQTGGTYSSTAGLVVDENSGAINLSASTPGTFVVTYNFSDGTCPNSTTASITINPFPIASINYAGSPYCATGSASVTQTGQGGGTYSAASGLHINETTGEVNLLTSTPGTYQVTYSFANEFCSNVATTSITVNAIPLITGTTKASHNGSDLTCATSTDGEITVEGVGANPLLYSKDGGSSFQASNVFTDLGQGTYQIVVKDNNGCISESVAVNIIAPESLTVGTSTVSNVTCNGGNDGSILLGSVTGGTPPYTYTWTKNGDATFFVSGTTPNLPNITAGTYVYNITDANNCANIIGSVTVTQPEVAVSQTNIACYGNSTGSATVSVTGTGGPFDFVWRNSLGQVIASENNNTTGSHQVGGLPAGTYQVSVSYPPSCTTIVTVTISQPSPLNAQILSHSDINCVSATSGSATVTPSGGTAPYTYLWNDPSGQTTATASGLAAGDYNVVVTDHNGCTAATTVTIVQDPAPVITNCPASNFAFNTDAGVCNYTIRNGELDILATDACPLTYTYTLTGVTTANNIVGSLDGTVLQKGTTHVTCLVSDGLQSSTCSFDVVVSDNEPPVITCPANKTINCQDSPDPDINISIGKATATDNCSATANIAVAILSDVSTQNPDASTPGHYNYTITRTWQATDEAGRSSTCQQVITVHDITPPANIVVPSDVTVSCASAVPAADDGAVTATDNCSPVTVTHEDVISNNTCTNRFVLLRTYTVTDVAGNSASMTQTITVFDDIAPVITSCPPASTFCYAASNSYTIALLTATDNCGGLTVSYHITGATSRDGTGNDASGSFNIGVSTIEWTVTDACNNTSTCSTTVTVYPIPATPVVVVSNGCGTSTLSTTATGSLLWTPGNQTSSSITVNTAGTYSVTSTINGCTSAPGTNVAAPITVPPTPVVNVVNNCDGTSVLSTTAPGTLLWSNFSTGSSITVFTGGTYSVTQSNSCYTSAPGFGVAAPTFGVNTPTLSVTQPNCSTPTGTITVTSPTTAGLTFSIDGVTYQSSPIFPGLVPNSYNVRVKTPAGCLSPDAIAQINAQPNTPAAPVVSVADHCDGTSTLSTTATGSLLWSTNSTGQSITVTTGGTYSVTQTVNGCTSLPGTGVAAPGSAPIAPIMSITQPNCATNTGTITVIAPTGTGLLYSKNGTDYQSSPIFGGLAENTSYSITVKNATGCLSPASPATINAAPVIPATPVVTVVNNCNGTSTLSTTATGSLLWSTNSTGQSITVNSGGIFSVTQTVNGCTSAPGFGMAAPNNTPAAPTVVLTQPTCETGTGTITITAPTGTLWTYSIDGTNYLQQMVFSGLAPNNYNVTAKNVFGCVSLITPAVINPQPATPLAPAIGTITQPTCSTATGSVVLSGLPAGNWIIYPGAIAGNSSSFTVTGLSTGSHNFSVTNAMGCISALSQTVMINPQPTIPSAPIIGTITQPTSTVPTGSVVLNGLPAGTWTINPGGITGNTPSTTVGNLLPNTFNFFTVTNAAGCTSPTSAPVFIDPPATAPPAPIVGTITQPTCITPSGSVVLSGLPSAGTWTLTRSPGGTTTTGSGTSTTIAGLAPGTYTYTVTDATGTSTSSANIVINAVPSMPTVAPITGTASVCVSGTTQLADVTASGVWSVTNGTGTATVGAGGLVTGVTPGNVTINYAVTNGCGTATATLSVTIIAGPSAAITYTSGAPANNLLAMPLNEGTGTNAADVSGNAHNGTLTAGPTWVAGRYGQAVNFNGTTNYINIPDHNDFTLTPTQSYTWSAWVRNTNFNEWGPVWSQTIDANNFFYFYAHSSSDAEAGPVTNGISVYWYNGANRLVLHSNNNVLAAGVWSHVAITYNGGAAQASRFSIYVNGVDVTNRTDVVSTGTIAVLNPTNIRIGSDQPYAEFFNGAVDEVRFYNRLLTGPEVQTDMNTPIAAPSSGTFCPSGTANVIQTGQAGGTYTSSPGLNINSVTGAINLAASTPGNYTVTYSFTNGTCPGTATANVVIAGQATNISYAGGPFCQNGTAAVTLNGQTGGTYSSTAGLNINGTTGAINLAASTAGTYTVTYSYGSAGCSGTATTSVTILAAPATSISYAGGPFCKNGTATVTQTGQAGGSYSSTSGLIINTSTGAINLGASAVGTYTVTYSFSNGNCSGTATTTVTINALPTATINFAGGPFCQSGSVAVTQTGQTGGTYSSTAGLAINGTTGNINLATSTPGNYTVTYSFGSGSCANTTTTSVTIVAAPTATISYAGGPFCPTGTAAVTQGGQAGGSYSSTAGLNINNATGSINLAASTPGTYTVTYSFSNGSCAGTTSTTVTINSLPTATIAYTATAATNQLVAMPLNEGAGTAAADISGRAHNGTLTGGSTWVAGRYGQATSFNGTSGYINIPDHNDFTLTPTQSYTWSSWVRNVNFNQWATVWSQTIDANNFFYFYAHSSTDAEAGPVTNGISVYWYNGTNRLVLHSNNNVLTTGVWSHVAITYNGGAAQASRFTIYVNGVDVTNRADVVSTGTIATINPTNIRIGSNQPYGEYLNGAVDEVRFYNRLLTVSEVQTDMNTAIAPFSGLFCQTGGTAIVTQTGQAGGTYSSTPGLNINSTNGAVNLAASTPGTYTVTYSFSNGTCANTATTTITVSNCLITRTRPDVTTPVAGATKSDEAKTDARMEVVVYPNPTRSVFNVKITSRNKETVEVKLFDMLGKVLQQQRGSPAQVFRLGNNIPSGVYVIEVMQAGQTVTRKVIKKSDESVNLYF